MEKYREEPPENGNPFDSAGGYSGQDYHVEREEAVGRQHPAGEVNPASDRKPAETGAGHNIPEENGRRAYFDPDTGEVHGSGSGAGGGNAGEDFDSDAQAGSGYPRTGRADNLPVDRSQQAEHREE